MGIEGLGTAKEAALLDGYVYVSDGRDSYVGKELPDSKLAVNGCVVLSPVYSLVGGWQANANGQVARHRILAPYEMMVSQPPLVVRPTSYVRLVDFDPLDQKHWLAQIANADEMRSNLRLQRSGIVPARGGEKLPPVPGGR